MAREKRTKPCGNCKRSKVKCEYTESLPCVRCVTSGLASTCKFVLKLPSLTLPLLNTHHVQTPYGVGYIPTARPMPNIQPQVHATVPTPTPHIKHAMATPKTESLAPSEYLTKANSPETESDWRAHMETKMDSVDSKFHELLTVLRENQDALRAERELNQLFLAQSKLERELQTLLAKRELEEANLHSKRRRYGNDDFRDTVLTMDEAKMLFKFFDEKISQQLFGFEIKKFSVETIWETSPILICAICTIASMHYPGQEISSKLDALLSHLHQLCAGLLFKKPRTEVEGFNTIVALVLCSFWLSDSQRFTGLALQLAKEFQLNNPVSKKPSKDSLSEKDRLKLWYLLYILDGQQSMAFHRQAILSGDDYSLKECRNLLLSDNSPKSIENKQDVEPDNKTEQAVAREAEKPRSGASNFTDLRLVSQVEYNQALNEAFKGNAWDLIAPNAFGIPSKSNLELDKWMVSWTVLLAPMNNGAVWLSKSTLIYYNFAKMHINSSIIRQLQVDTGDETVVFPKWDSYSEVVEVRSDKSNIEVLEHDSDLHDEDSDDEFVGNSELVAQDENLLNLNIAVNAAQTVLNLVLNDPDILNNLKYVPVHIHIMLYYAALLLVNNPLELKSSGSRTAPYFEEIITNLKTLRVLQRKIYFNLPTDKLFGDRLLQSLDHVFTARSRKLKSELDESLLDVQTKAEFLNELSALQFTSSQIEAVPDTTETRKSVSPKPEKMSAWPGSHHGHP